MNKMLHLLTSMPICYNGLVVETTTRCTARCDICYQSSGPKGEFDKGEVKLDIEVLKQTITEAITIPNLTKRFHLAGGEAFIYSNECLSLFETAQKVGFLEITGTTNAFWASDLEKARALSLQLRNSGVTSLEISWDYWHQKYIKPSCIHHAVKACYEAGIETNLRVLTTKSHSIQEALNQLSPSCLNQISRISSGPVFANGRALETIKGNDFHQSKTGDQGHCHGALQLTVNSRGEVAPCCAGFDQNKLYRHGTIHDASIVEIVEKMNRDPIIRNLVFMGPRSLLPMIMESGVKIGDDCKNMCHLCWMIFTSKEAVDAIKAHKEKAINDALIKVVDILESSESDENP